MAEYLIRRRNGEVFTVLLDEDKYDLVVGSGPWCVSKSTNAYYVVRSRNNRLELLHRWLIDAPAGLYVDHINCNPLDNRLRNLRLCQGWQNNGNTRKPSNNTSGFKGVTLEKRTGRWVAQLLRNKKKIHLGTFDSKEEAHRAYCDAAAKLFGEFFNPG